MQFPDTRKKVFIFHFDDKCSEDKPVLKLAVTLCHMRFNVALDMFEYDNPPMSWPLWYENNMKSSNVVLCIITEKFCSNLGKCDHRVMTHCLYNLMRNPNVAIIPVFLDSPKVMDYVPLSLQGTHCYCISSQNLLTGEGENKEFVDLLNFLIMSNLEKSQIVNGSELELYYCSGG